MARHINKIPNPQPLTTKKEETSFDVYSALLGSSVTGMTVDEIELRLSIKAKLMKAAATVVLEEVEWEILVACLKSQKWVIASQFIVDFCKAVNNAEQKDAK